jgi:hypothetical protein
MAGSQRSQPNAAGAYAAGAAPAAGAGAGAGQRRRSAVEPQLSPICRQLHSAARTRGRQPELRNAAPRYADVTGCSLPTEPGEAGWPALTVGWHAGCSHARRCLSAAGWDACVLWVCVWVWPCAWSAVRLIELGPTLSARTSHLSTVDYRPSTLRRPTSPHGAPASSQQPAASSQPVDLQSHPQNAAHRLRAAPGPDCARNIRLGLPMAYAGRTKKPLELRLSRLTSSACRLVVVAASAVFPAIRSRGATLGAMRCLPIS